MSRTRCGSIKHNSRYLIIRRLSFWNCAFEKCIRRRAEGLQQLDLTFLAHKRFSEAKQNALEHIERSTLISCSNFEGVFAEMGDAQCLQHFWFLCTDVLRMDNIVFDGAQKYSTKRNSYRTSKLLSTCLFLERMSTPLNWSDIETIFRKHSSQMSEIFWETCERFMERYKSLVTGPIGSIYFADRSHYFAERVKNKLGALDNCVGFIDGTVIEIARPSDDEVQNVVYTGDKRKHALKFQAVTTPDGMFFHVFGPTEKRRHDWTLFCRSEIEDQLESVLRIEELQFVIYGDSGYNEREFIYIPFQGTLKMDQAAFNKPMSDGRVTVEWMFKEVKTFWTFIDFRRKMRILQLPVGALYLAGILLCNMRYCVYPNQTSIYFNCNPPTLTESLSWRD